MELPEVGSKWVAIVDNPRGVDRIKRGDVVEVTDRDNDLVGYTGGWCCVKTEWHNNFEPYQEEKREFQVGDKVVVSGYSYNNVMGFVTRTDGYLYMVSTKVGLEEHETDGDDFHLCFHFDQMKKRKFQVGDKVKCLHPTVVCTDFKGEVGTVIHLLGCDLEDGQQIVEIKFPDGCSQRAYVDLDGVVLVEPAQTKKPPTGLTAEGYTPKDIEELFESMSEDNVHSPSHYGQGNIEAIEYIKDFLTKEEYIGYLRGNIAKYLHRWRYKNGVEDLEKARVYLGWLIEEME